MEEYTAAFGEFLKRDISILVNNVGYFAPSTFSPYIDYFAKLPFDEIRREMKINMLPIAILTRLFLDPMKTREHRSGIINVGSGAAMTCYAGTAHYSATKKFIDFFSQSVGYECSDRVDFLLVRPYVVSTTMTHNVQAFYTTTVDKCAKAIVDSLGTKDYCYGPFIHNLQGVGSEFFHQEFVSRAFTSLIIHFGKLYNAVRK